MPDRGRPGAPCPGAAHPPRRPGPDDGGLGAADRLVPHVGSLTREGGRFYVHRVSDPDVVERLVRLGLTKYEARAYAALVRRDGSTPAEVARVAGVPRPRVYDVMDSLVAKGLVVLRPRRA